MKKAEYDKNWIRKDAPDWFKRLYKEWAEASEKFQKLSLFINTKVLVGKVTTAQGVLLKRQKEVMKEYLDILYLRLRLGTTEESEFKDKNPMWKEFGE